jgi:hypothetical protein
MPMLSLEEEARRLRDTLVDVLIRDDFTAFKAVMFNDRVAQMVTNTVAELTGRPAENSDEALKRRMTLLKRLFLRRIYSN